MAAASRCASAAPAARISTAACWPARCSTCRLSRHRRLRADRALHHGRCGTPLAEIEAALAEKGQMLAFEPPRFGGATVGGCVAAGLSGPRRQQAGAVRDFVLGVKLIDGSGRCCDFGGQVMKNVAGYDVSRLMAGSLGTLGLIAEVTLKVLPKPVAEADAAFLRWTRPGRSAGSTSGAASRCRFRPAFWHDGQLAAPVRARGGGRAACRAGRLAGRRSALRPRVTPKVTGIRCASRRIRLRRRPPCGACRCHRPRRRRACPACAAIEWGGAQRWYAGELAAVRGARGAGRRPCRAVPGGRVAALSRRRFRAAVAGPAAGLHRRLKQSFDPRGILNPGRLYAEF
jgi:glycolate oxidase FAD binding subunit